MGDAELVEIVALEAEAKAMPRGVCDRHHSFPALGLTADSLWRPDHTVWLTQVPADTRVNAASVTEA